MAEDKRNFIERSDSIAEKSIGRPATVEERAAAFSKFDLEKRIDILEALDRDIESDEPLTIEEAAKLYRTRDHRNALSKVHHALRRRGR